MASRKIDGTKHIRRKLKARAKIAISVAVLAVVSLGGLLFINTTDKGVEVKERIAQMSVVSEEYESEELYGEGSKPSSEVESIIKITTEAKYMDVSEYTPDIVLHDFPEGYTNGGGTITSEDGDVLTITASAPKEYVFKGWIWTTVKIPYLKDHSSNPTIKIGYDNGTTTSDADLTFNKNTHLTALFYKESSGVANSTYSFRISPEVGIIHDIQYKDNNKNNKDLNPGTANYEFAAPTGMQELNYITWELSYVDLERNFTYETKTHSAGETHTDDKSKVNYTDNDSYTISKKYYIEYDVYGYDENGNKFCEVLNKSWYETIDLHADKMPPPVTIGISSVPVPKSKGGRYYYIIVPHTLSGSKYQAITVSDPKDGGSTSGDRTSNSPFSTTLSAVPAKGYQFDRWTWRDNLGDIYKTKDVNVNNYRDMESKEASTSVTPNGTIIYTAHFVPAHYNVDLENVTPEKGGSVHGLGDYAAHSDVPITIHPASGYKVDNWTYTTKDGDSYSGNSENFTIKDLSLDIKISVKFTSTKARIDVKASPVDGGTVLVRNSTLHPYGAADDKPEYDKPDYEEFVMGEESARLVARPADKDSDGTLDYTFLYWKDSKGNIYNGEKQSDESNVLTLNNVASSDTFTAYFAPEKIIIKTKVYPDNTAGGVEVTGATPINSSNASEGYVAKPNTSVTLKAVEATGYHFQKFVDDSGKEYQSNPLVKSDLVTDTTFTAIFVPDEFTISVEATPVIGGKASVAVNGGPAREGSNTASYGDSVTLTATPAKDASGNNKYSFKYFEDHNGNKFKGTETPANSGTYQFTFEAVNGAETYKAVFGMSEVSLSVTVDPKNKDETDSTKYKAGGFKIDYTGTDGKPVNVLETFADWTTDGEINKKIKGQTSVKITAVPGDGYRFSKFVDTDGNVYTENPLVYPDLSENKEVEIIFVPETFTISAQAAPVIGGRAEISVNGGPAREGSNTVSYNDKVKITAIPNAGYAFKYFEDKNGSKYAGTIEADGKSASFEFNAVNGSETYKAVFAMSQVQLKVKVDPNTTDSNEKYIAGKFKVNYTYTDITGKDQNVTREGDAPGFEIDNIKGQTSVKITAVELGGYKFSKFIDSEGNTWTESPMVLGDLVESKDIEVIFVKEHWRIDVQSSPESGGRVTVNGVESGVDVDYGDHVKIEAKPNEGYTFRYFKDALGNEFLSNPLEFDAINGSEKYTAYFAKNDVSITIDLAPEGSGTVRFNSEPAVSKRTTYSTAGKSSVVLTATPKEDVKFLYWRDQDGNTYADNPLTLTDISRELIFTAVFDTKFDTIRAIASPASGGKITKIINDDGSITLIAKANRGYRFTSWKKPNGRTFAYKFTIPADQVNTGDVYIAYFKEIPGYDHKSDITKESFYREWRRVVTPNYTVTRESMKLLAAQTVAGLKQYDDATPELKGYGAIANARAYFDERVAKDIERLDGVFGDSELMTAEGEILTPDLLPDDVKYFSQAENFTDKKFGDRYDTEILTVKRVLEPENFNNEKRTYLWRYTGAEYKDNIYLLYNISGDKHEWATPIVDEDGVLKFTIDTLKDNDVVAVVKVKIK